VTDLETRSEEDDTERPGRSVVADLREMLKWALVAAGITLVFGMLLNVLEAVL
jgi:hypothetical protein